MVVLEEIPLPSNRFLINSTQLGVEISSEDAAALTGAGSAASATRVTEVVGRLPTPIKEETNGPSANLELSQPRLGLLPLSVSTILCPVG